METLTRTQKLVVLLATLMAVTVTANLGAWQLRRADQKLARQAALDERARLPELTAAALARTDDEAVAQQHRRVRLRGHWLHQFTVYLDNRQMNGVPGFYVITPLQPAEPGLAVLVQRGWVPRNWQNRTQLPAFPTPAGEVEVIGRIAPPPARLYEFPGAASGPIRQNLELSAYAHETGLRLAPLSVLQDDPASGANDGLLRQWPRPALGLQTHYGYAFQWFALSALMAGLYVWFQLVRPRLRRTA
jgi:surfeit locus 1 family protein